MTWTWITRIFDVRPGERRITFLMFGYIFLLICVLLIVKPIVNALFLSELGAEQLPLGFILVALAAIGSSLLYARMLERYRLIGILKTTLVLSGLVFATLGICLHLGFLPPGVLYILYPFTGVYAVLTASQFWVLANLVFNLRDAKRLFGFIGSGAILGGIVGGYLTSLISPWLGNGFMLGLAAAMLLALIPMSRRIWALRLSEMNPFRERKRTQWMDGHPLGLIRKSNHLTHMALIVGVSVMVAKLVDFLFGDFAARAIPDSDELSSFFGFWFSTFNLLALAVQLFLTKRIVGIWGVGFSLLLLPLGVLFGSLFFLVIPELSAVVAIKAMDGILKQSVTKSASELLALPLPFDLKNKTKSFIDVVVDSVATGAAGLVLIFLIKGLDLKSQHVVWLVIVLVLLWAFLIHRVRRSYYESFRQSLLGPLPDKRKAAIGPRLPALEGIRSVFREGTSSQILYMLGKVLEINDSRLREDVRALLDHPEPAVKAAAFRNLYYLDAQVVPANIPELLSTGDPELTEAIMDFLIQHSRADASPLFDRFLDDPDPTIAQAALFALARESQQNRRLKQTYLLEERLAKSLGEQREGPTEIQLKTIGWAASKKHYPLLLDKIREGELGLKVAAMEAAGAALDPVFVLPLVEALTDKKSRAAASQALRQYGPGIVPRLLEMVRNREVSIESCRFIPMVVASFESSQAVRSLFEMIRDVDLSVRLEVIRALNLLREKRPELRYDRFGLVKSLFDECQLYQRTLSAMHTQIIISYRNRKKGGQQVNAAEKDARASLLELLERRLDAGLERIFRLLGLRYPQQDLLQAYAHFKSPEEHLRTQAIDYLDHLLTGSLKQRILPIIEEAGRDLVTADSLDRRKERSPSEQECFKLLMDIPDLRMRLAVLYLVQQIADRAYMPMLRDWADHPDPKIRDFAGKAIAASGQN